MLSGLELKQLAQRVLDDEDLPLGHPAKVLARAIMVIDDPLHFVRNITLGMPVPNPLWTPHRQSPKGRQ